MLYSRLFFPAGENEGMYLSRLALITIAVGLFATACNKAISVGTNKNIAPAAPASSLATPDEFVVARATFAKRCSICHGDSGEGKTAEIEGKKIKGPNL